MAACLASGVEWLGFQIPAATPVVYVQLDTPRTLWADRVQQLSHGGYPVELVHMADRETLETYPFDILRPDHFALLTTSLKGLMHHSDEGYPVPLEPGAVVIDTLRESHSGDENDSTEMQKVIAHLEAAVKPAALILISHSRKTTDADPSLMNDNRGSNYVVGRMDAICRFSRSSMRVVSRTTDEQTIKLDRLDDGTWRVEKDPWLLVAESVMRSSPGDSSRELARKVRSLTQDRSEPAARAWFRRQGRA